MGKQDHGHGHHGGCEHEHLLTDILDALVTTESRNDKRHSELIAAFQGRVSEADRKLLDALLKRSEFIARKLEALDAQTP